MTLRFVTVAAAFAALVCFANPAHADDAAAPSPEVTRLLSTGHSIKWNAVPQGKSQRYGHSEALVNASPERILQILTAYGQYKDLVPEKFKTSRIIGKDATGTDVYCQLPMKGPLPITLAPIFHFGPVRTNGNESVVEGTFIRGTYVKDANVVFTVKRVSNEVSLLKLDLLLLPTIPAPQSIIDEELRDAAMDAVNAVHDKAQGNGRQVTALNN